MAKILIIEDEENVRFSMAQSLRKAGHEVSESAAAESAWELMRSTEIDVVLTDVNLEGAQTGVDLMKRLREDGFEGVILILTAYGSIQKAVDAMKAGADDYLQKPIGLEELNIIVNRAMEHRRVRARLHLYERLEASKHSARDLIGEDPAWVKTLAMADRLASLPLPNGAPAQTGVALPTILLLAETGAGKGVLARRIHAQASELAGDPSAPFVHVNCSALPAALVESELFGHERGAFTDAKSARSGLFEMAEGGTIFLDEIGDMPLDLQAKLLLVVEQGIFRRVGGSRDRSVRARVIAATNQDLAARSATGEFRQDLYYRLNAFTVEIPPLRARADDIMLIADAMLERFGREYRRPGMSFNVQAAAAMKHHAWPGNVRELINAIQRAVMLCEGETIGPADLGLNGQATRKVSHGGVDVRPGVGVAGTNGSSKAPLAFDFDNWNYSAEEVERELIVQALQRVKGNVSKAAKLIGMNRSSLRYRIERGGLEELVKEMAQQ